MNTETVGIPLAEKPQAQAYEIASLNQRFFGFLWDRMLVTGSFLIAALIFGTGLTPFNIALFSGNNTTVLYIAVDAVYHVFFWTRPRGQTPGKRYVNNRVIKVDGSRLTLRDALIRYVFTYVNSLLLGVGWMRMVFGREHRGGHDWAAGTVVVLNEPSATADTAPFRPRAMGCGWIIFGLPIVAMMAAVNWRRFGRPERYQPTLLTGLVLALALDVIGSHPAFYQLLSEPMQLAGIVSIVIGIPILYCFLLIRSQAADYKVWREGNGVKHPTFHQSGRKTYNRILLVAIIVNVSYVVVLGPLLVNLTVPLLPNREYTDRTISLTFPGGWWTSTDFDGIPFCQQSGVTCLIAGNVPLPQIIHFDFEIVNGIDSSGAMRQISFELERFDGLDTLSLSAKQADEQVWTAIQAQNPTAKLISRNVREIDGRVAVERRYRTGPNTGLSIYIKDRSGIYRFYIAGPNDIFAQQLSAMETVLRSVRFVSQP